MAINCIYCKKELNFVFGTKTQITFKCQICGKYQKKLNNLNKPNNDINNGETLKDIEDHVLTNFW